MGPRASARADAIVVLGCALHDGAPSPALRHRVVHSIALFARGDAPLLLFSGGGRQHRSEAEAMHEIAVALGIPKDAMLLETASRNTFENAVETARLMRAHGLASLILVSSAYHLPRARMLFRHTGLTIVATAHPPSRGVLRELPFWLREGLALVPSCYRILLARRRPAQ